MSLASQYAHTTLALAAHLNDDEPDDLDEHAAALHDWQNQHANDREEDR
ncbi:hypothetical protein [Cellulomonas sp. A375-1]|nr:hypothetical protein [Cellulomonas sp. A375-1]